jgi:hypothetical protein
MKVKLLAQSEHERLRWYIPGTFDAMMVDFGSRVERKDLLTKLERSSTDIIEHPKQGDINEISL